MLIPPAVTIASSIGLNPFISKVNSFKFFSNFNLSSFPILIISGIAIITLDYLMSIITGIHDVPLGRGLVGFTTAAIIIYITQFVVDGYYISITSSLIAAAIYGVIDSMLINKK